MSDPLSPAAATRFIRSLYGESLELMYTKHCRERMVERDLIVGDIFNVIRYGFVHKEAEKTTRNGIYKYAIECVTPNSNGRTVRVIVIPSKSGQIKIVSVMWADEGR